MEQALSPNSIAAALDRSPREVSHPPVRQPIIHVEGLGKRFKLYGNPWGRSVEWLSFGRARRHDDFWALQDVTFDLQRGRSLGIIGVNGSGKSTLLKILSGAMYATTGKVEVRGRVLSLLELGTGLNPELSGRHNVINSARLLAFPPAYATTRMGQIEQFAELAEFFDRPVRLYSSGMLVRLSFSMFACFDPEIFVIDEALSVGDIFFQQKCVRRIEQMLESGVTMLFVSHDMQLVRRLCDRTILLSHGRIDFDGPPDECVTRYYSRSAAPDARPPTPHRRADVTSLPQGPANGLPSDILAGARSRHGPRDLELAGATLQDESGAHTLSVRQMQSITIHVRVRAQAHVSRPSAGLHLFDRLGNLVFAAGTAQHRREFPPMRPGEERTVTFRLTLCVQPGEYTLSLGCAQVPESGGDVGVVQDQYEGIGPIAVHAADGQMPRFYGIAQLPMEISVE